MRIKLVVVLLLIVFGQLNGKVFNCFVYSEYEDSSMLQNNLSMDLKNLEKEPLLPKEIKQSQLFDMPLTYCKTEKKYLGKLGTRNVYD